ncbi:hypothetical protein FRO03_26120 [Escherichia coli]|nr:hypothetical protein [Escherichia coli]
MYTGLSAYGDHRRTDHYCASSLIRSLRSVMRLRRALPPQSCGKTRHYRTEQRRARESTQLNKSPKRRCYLI